MGVKIIKVEDWLSSASSFDALIDARSPAEFLVDHLPNSQNWPVLDDEERKQVGTLYVRVGALEARKLGATLVARRIAQSLERHLEDKPKSWRPLVYCWRGGQRSGSLAWFLDQIGFRTYQLQGGYKAFRETVRQQLSQLPQALRFIVVGGRTGSGKSRLLQQLKHQGAQVLDLEALAAHRGSVLGGLPDCEQPTQKAFDTAVWHELRRFNPERPIFVESESRKIGRLQLPEALLTQMRTQGEFVLIEMSDAARTELLLQDYAHFGSSPEQVENFCQLIGTLVELRGRQSVEHWQSLARQGLWADVFNELMTQHYDPLYLKSMRHNFAGLERATSLTLEDGNEKALREAAQGLIDRFDPKIESEDKATVG